MNALEDSIEYAEAWTAAIVPKMPANVITFPVGANAAQVNRVHICPRCGANNPFVNFCKCDPNNLPTTIIPELSAFQRQQIENIVDGGRADVIKAIKNALQRRSDKAWSVTGGRGTAWGWLEIDAPPARRTFAHRPRAGKGDCPPPGDENWEYVDTGETGNNISASDAAELAKLLGLDRVHYQGHSIPSGDWKRGLCQALHGHAGPFTAKESWD